MRMNRFFIFVLLIVLGVSFVSSQLDNAGKQIESGVGNLENNVTQIREFTDVDKWEFIGAQWKDFLLKSKFISGINTFFNKINIVFVILFGMDWNLSMQMFFAILLWLFTFFSILRYMISLDKGGIGILYSFIGVVLLAQINFFEYVAKWSVALVFYNGSILWRILFFVVIIAFFVIWFLLNKSISDMLKKKKEKEEKNKGKETIETLSQMVNAAVDSS